MATKEATYFETYGLAHWKVSSLLPYRSPVRPLASPPVNGSLPFASLKQALSHEGFFLIGPVDLRSISQYGTKRTPDPGALRLQRISLLNKN
jgi:hypothetical protein